MLEYFVYESLAILGFAGVMVPLVLYAIRVHKRRLSLAAGWAAARGYSFLESNAALVPYLRGEPFPGGDSAKVQEFIYGTTPSGRTFCSFKYTYEESSGGRPSTTVNRSVVMVRVPAVLPALSVSYEGFGDKVQKLFGGQDIELESEDFNRLFRVMSPVESFAYAVLHPRMMEWLMGPARGLVPFRVEGSDVMCWREGKPDYSILDGQLAAMSDFADQIPHSVIEQYAAPPSLGWTVAR